MRAALKTMSPTLKYHWHMSGADVGGMAVEVEHSHYCSITFSCRVMDGSRGAV